MERRESVRDELDLPVQISIEDKNITCNILNLSEDGALLKINSQYKDNISNEDLGKDTKFILRQYSSSDREYTGEIIRLFYRDNEMYIALRFWEKYKELN